MAFSGGTGTDIDPYLISTPQDLIDMNSSSYAGDYFELTQDINLKDTSVTFGLIGQNFDGKGHRLYNWERNQNQYFTAPVSSTTIQNIEFHISATGTNAGPLIQNTSNTDCVFKKLTFISYNKRVGHLFGGIVSNWIVEDIRIIGNIEQFVQNVVGVPTVKRIFVDYYYIEESVAGDDYFKLNTGSMAINFEDSSVTQLRYKIKSNGAKFVVSTVTGLKRCNFHFKSGQVIYGARIALYSNISTSIQYLEDVKIVFDEIRSSIYPITENGNISLLNLLSFDPIANNALFDGKLKRIFVKVNTITGTLFDFESLDPSLDWYIPSRDELMEMRKLRNNEHFDNVVRGYYSQTAPNARNFYSPLCSSQSNSVNIHSVNDSGTSSATTRLKSTLSTVHLVRDLADIPEEVIVGDLFEDTVVIYKSGTFGIGAARFPIFGGAPIFNYSNTGSIDTSTEIGTGKANTVAMLSASSAISAANWRTRDLSPLWCNLIASTALRPTAFVDNYITLGIQAQAALETFWDDVSYGAQHGDGVTYLPINEVNDIEKYQNWDFIEVWEIAQSEPLLRVLTENFPYGKICMEPIRWLSEDSFMVEFYDHNGIGQIKLSVSNELTDTVLYEGYGPIQTVVLPEPGNFDLIIDLIVIDGPDEVHINRYYYTHTEAYICPIAIIYANNRKLLKQGSLEAKKVHGDYMYNGRYYGSPRESMAFPSVNTSNYDDIQYIVPFVPDVIYDGPGGASLWQFESLTKVDRYLFARGQPLLQGPFSSIDGFLVMIDTSDYSAYKVFRFLTHSTEPITSDDTYLYITDRSGDIHKINADIFINAPNQYYVEDYFELPEIGSPDHLVYSYGSQGAHIDLGFTLLTSSNLRNHAIENDSEYLYVALTSGNGHANPPEGYEEFIHSYELHAIRKSDMTPAGWRFIPKSTDDMTQNENWLFFGHEQSNPDRYGSTWGTFAVNKNDLLQNSYNAQIKALPRLHPSDDPPNSVSYASLIFGNYLLDFKTNKLVYVLDMSDPNKWGLDTPVGKFTRFVFDIRYSWGGIIAGVLNEAKADEGGSFHSFEWFSSGGPSGVLNYDLPQISVFAAPTLQANISVLDDEGTLFGFVLNENGKPVTEVGFEWGTSPDPEEWTNSVQKTLAQSFSHVLSDLADDLYYFRAYGVNSEGTGYSNVISFRIGDEPDPDPTIATLGSTTSTVNNSSVTLNSSVIDDGGSAITASGFEYGTSVGNLSSSIGNAVTLPALTATLNDLAPGTYYYRAFATNGIGTVYSSEQSFQINEIPIDPTIITGVVRYQGEPVQGATVYAFLKSDITVQETVQTDAFGVYLFDSLDPGEYLVFTLFDDNGETRRSTVKIFTVTSN